MDPKQRMIRRDFDLVFDGVGLKAYTKTIDGKEVKFIGGTASSNAKDLYGDVISPEGQVMMLTKLRHLAEEMKDANSGLTGWLNHSYKIPEDTLGAFVDASLATRTGDGVDGEKGVEYIDLDIECRVTDTNPRAVAAWEQVKDGIRHGWSIGAIFTDCEWASNDPDSPDYWSLLVHGVNLLEISLVGIPANQRAWCKSQEDVKARAVKAAEEIVREAHAQKSGDRSVARDEAKLRGMVLKSLVHTDEPADTASTSPIAARNVNPGAQLELVTNEAQPERKDCACVEAHEGECKSAAAQGEAVNEEPKSAEPQAGATLSIERPDGNIPGLLAANELLSKAFGVTLAAVIDGEKWVGTEIRSATVEGDEIKVGEVVKSADEIDLRAFAKTLLGVDESEVTELGAQLRALDGDEATKALAQQAADAIDVLVKAADVHTRDAAASDLSPDDVRARIALAVGHIAKAVGHGICARAAGHLQKACVELSAAVGSEVDQPAPGGDEDPAELSAQVQKLEPKAGDVIVLRVAADIDPARVEAFRKEWEASINGATFMVLGPSVDASIDNDLASKVQTLTQKQQELADATTALEAKHAELQTAETTLSEKQTALAEIEQKAKDAQSELSTLEAKIAEAKEMRLGRKSSFDFKALLEERSGAASEVKPEHYQRNATEQKAALARTTSGDGQPLTGRDIAAGL